MNNIITIKTTLTHGGVIFQTQVHLENILSSLGPEVTYNMVANITGKIGTFNMVILQTLTDKIAYNTLTLLWEQAIIDHVEKEWQENVYYLINNYESNDIL